MLVPETTVRLTLGVVTLYGTLDDKMKDENLSISFTPCRIIAATTPDKTLKPN